jgi:hypothetical protein
MQVDLFATGEHVAHATEEATRIEIPFVHQSERQYKIIVLDADDTLDVIIHFPDGEREAVWSLVKDE